MKLLENDRFTCVEDDEIWSLLELFADFYWQENTAFQCTFLRVADGKQEQSSPLANLCGSTLWDIGCLITGRGQNWRQHLTQRNMRQDFKELICRLPAPFDAPSEALYISISGKARFGSQGEFIGYHCYAREVTDLVQTENSLRRFRAAMDMSGDMIYLIDRKTLHYLDVNDTALQNSGLSREVLLRTGPLDDNSQDSRETLERLYDRLIIEGGTSRLEHEAVDAQGQQLFLETSNRASSIDGNWIIISATRNITRRKRSEEIAQKLHRMYSSLSETNAASLRAVSIESLYHSVCDAAAKAGRFSVVSVFAADGAGNLHAVAYAGQIETSLRTIIVPLDSTQAKGQSLIGTAFHTGEHCVSNDFLHDPRTHAWQSQARENNIRSAASFPLLCHNKPVSVLFFYAYEENVFDEEMVQLLQNMANNISFALDNFSNEEQRKEAEHVLRESEERFRSLTHLSSDFYWEMDNHYLMRTYEGRVVGDSNMQAVAALKGRALWSFEGLICNTCSWEEFQAVLHNQERFKDLEISFTNDTGVVYHLSMSGEPMFDCKKEFRGYRGISRDVTERRKISNHIEYLATHDNLTGLPNRAKFNELLENNARLAELYKERIFALLFIDVDRFKKVNDTYGHHVGDALLKEVARSLQKSLADKDIVARLGGDEFVILLNGERDREGVAAFASKIIQTFRNGIFIDDIHCDISLSIGISVFGDDAKDEESLLKNADAAMYKAKESGKTNYRFYQEAASDAAHAS